VTPWLSTLLVHVAVALARALVVLLLLAAPCDCQRSCPLAKEGGASESDWSEEGRKRKWKYERDEESRKYVSRSFH